MERNAVEPIGLGESQENLVVQVESLAWRLELSYLTVLALFNVVTTEGSK